MGIPPQERNTNIPKGLNEIKNTGSEPSLSVYDVTGRPEEEGVAQYRVAEVYKALFAAPHIGVIDVLDGICNDRYAKAGRTRTLMARPDIDQESDSRPDLSDKVLGVIRLIKGKKRDNEADLSPIEAMETMTPPEGWNIFLREGGLSPDNIGELGRLAFEAVPPEKIIFSRELIENNIRVLKEMREVAFAIAREDDVKAIFAVMPPGIASYFERGGYQPIEIKGATINKNDKVMHLRRDYPGYWAPSNPRKLPKLWYMPVLDIVPQKYE